jgi:hypothetical protein
MIRYETLFVFFHAENMFFERFKKNRFYAFRISLFKKD